MQRICDSGSPIQYSEEPKIDSAKEEIAVSIDDIRSDYRDDLYERLAKIEEAISQIKAKTGI